MSHYAKVLNGIVQQVIVAEDNFFSTFIDTSPGEWIQTSYNTRGNMHYAPNSNTLDGGEALRGNYASIGYNYDKKNDVFYAPQPFPSWTLNTATWTWESPIPNPGSSKSHRWDEDTKIWIEITE